MEKEEKEFMILTGGPDGHPLGEGGVCPDAQEGGHGQGPNVIKLFTSITFVIS